MPTTPQELRSRFALDNSVNFQDMAEDALHHLGISDIPPSYRTVKELFGHSRLASDISRFWIAAATDPHPQQSMTTLKEIFDARCDSWELRQRQRWRPLVDRHGLSLTSFDLGTPRWLPLFCNSEYDYWLCWNTARLSVHREPEVCYFDFGQQIMLGVFPDLIHVYTALADGVLVDPLPINQLNRIQLTAWETW